MSEIQWINDGNSAIINGWYFHFHWMCAFRGSGADLDRRELIEKYADSNILSWHRFEDRCYDVVSRRRLAGHTDHGMWGAKDVWYAFFTPPEDHYNKLVQEAYETYLLEKSISETTSTSEG